MPHFKTSDGLTLHYTDEGAGVPILCLAGLTRNSQDFSYISDKFSGVRLIKMDYRGRGKSDWASDYTTYNIPRESQDALELMDHLNINRFAVLGTSRGGMCALTIGAIEMQRLMGVAFNDIGPVIEQAGIDVIMNFVGRNPGFQTLSDAAAARPKAMAGFANVPNSRWRDEVAKLYHQAPDGLIINYDPKLRDAISGNRLEDVPDLWPFYEALSHVPIAVIRGAHSDILSRETFLEMGKRIPHAISAQVADRGHVPFLDEPEALHALRQWIAKLA